MNPEIRKIQQPEIPFLDEMLYNAIFIPEGREKPPKDIIKLPELARYIKDFGRKGDICLVAESDGSLTGAIWTRLFTEEEKGYSFVDGETPEVSMAVLEPFRSKGIGHLLMNTMLDELKKQNYPKVSLSVDRENYAFEFYLKCGFKIVTEPPGESVTMIKHFNTV